MRKIEVVLSDERLITPSGLCMVGQAMAKSDLIKKAAGMKTEKRSQPQIKNGDILLTEIGMLTLGKTDFDYVNEFYKDKEYYKMSLGIAYGIPSEATFRMRLDTIGQSMNTEILSGNISLLKACHHENRDEMAAELRKVCKNISCPREGKTVYMGSTWRTVHTEEKGDITIRMVYEIIDRTIAVNGQEMLFPDTKFNMYCTSLSDPDEDIIELYHNHAICEQFHSEIKTDMDMEQMPSGKFDTYALILKLGMIAYNILRIIGTEAMKKNDKTIKRRRIRTVIERLMMIAGHLTAHARKVLLALGRSSPWTNTFIRIWRVLSEA